MTSFTLEPLAQYPLHRDKYLSLETPVNGVGCYVQLCEARLTKYIDEDRNLYDTNALGRKPFLDKFIQDIYVPLLKSKCKAIVINIDPLRVNSNRSLLEETAKRLLSLDNSPKRKIDRTRDDTFIRSTDRVNIIIPNEHVNGCVGRNISFWFIRTTLYDNGLYWFGSDDDDSINFAGVNSLSSFITYHVRDYDHSKVILFDDRYLNKLRQPTSGYTRYAPWSYAFSPEYYDGISFPCCPLEKEDLDVFNRFMQHPEAIVNRFQYEKKDEIIPLYLYAGPGVRSKDHRLYHTKDIIAYMNAHNRAESKDIPTPAPLSTPQKEVHRKAYFMNRSPRYFIQNDEIRRRLGAYYGIANIDEEPTYKDQRPDFTLSELVAMEEFNDNFNGDLYIIPFTVYNQTNHRLYGACFQNGKLPEVLPKKEYTRYIPTENEESIHQTLTELIPDYADIFYARTIKYTKRELGLIQKWNDRYLKENRSSNQWIPLKTFGGSKSKDWLLVMVFLLIGTLITVVIYCIYRSDVSEHQSNVIIDTDKRFH